MKLILLEQRVTFPISKPDIAVRAYIFTNLLRDESIQWGKNREVISSVDGAEASFTVSRRLRHSTQTIEVPALRTFKYPCR